MFVTASTNRGKYIGPEKEGADEKDLSFMGQRKENLPAAAVFFFFFFKLQFICSRSI